MSTSLSNTENLPEYVFSSNKQVRLYTLQENIEQQWINPLIKHANAYYTWVNDPSEADYFLLASNYEFAHDPTHAAATYFQHDPQQKQLLLAYEDQLIALAKQYGKKLIVVYYNDSAAPIPLDNAIIFRTSIVKSNSHSLEHCIPVLKQDLSQIPLGEDAWISWNETPSIGFRGIAEPFNLKTSRQVRNSINLLANQLNIDNIFNLKKNFGYLQRRNAMQVLAKQKTIATDFSITTEKDADDVHATQLYRDNMFRNAYALCASGFGNYSYRFYEALSAGRIPVFINTDCKLPFEEYINWSKHMVWIEEKDIVLAADILLDFHQHNKGDAFVAIQQNNKAIWNNLLKPEAFYANVKYYL